MPTISPREKRVRRPLLEISTADVTKYLRGASEYLTKVSEYLSLGSFYYRMGITRRTLSGEVK
jgi:hypothetical protein